MAVVIYTVGWWFGAHIAASRINGWIAGEQAKGAKISPATIAVGGYPFAFSVKLTDVTLAEPNGLAFTSQSLKLRARPWSPGSFKVNATGGFALTLPPGTRRPALRIAGETLRGHARFSGSPLPLAVDFSADTMTLTEPGDTPSDSELTVATVEFTGSRPMAEPKVDTDIAYDLSFKLIDLSTPALESNPLGSSINLTQLHMQLLGVPPETWNNAGIKAWRDAGGAVNLPDMALKWGQLDIGGNGTLALDADMQPEGAFTVKLTGFEQALDSLAAAGWMKLSVASVTKLALGIASREEPDGKRTVSAPLTIQNRHISLGPAKVGQVPELKLD